MQTTNIPTVSLCMIVKNEEGVIEKCLESVGNFADEIIIVDTGSKDNTMDIVQKYPRVRLFTFPWSDDFSAARNFAFSKATCDWIMWLDADDIFYCKDNLRFKLQYLTGYDGAIRVPYVLTLDKDGDPDFWYYRERIIRRDNFKGWVGRVHETADYDGFTWVADLEEMYVKHCPQEGKVKDPQRNLRIYRKMLEEDPTREFTPRELYYYGRELYYAGFYKESTSVLEAFITKKDAWVQNIIEALSLLVDIYLAQDLPSTAKTKAVSMLEYSLPTPEICCKIAMCFEKSKEYKEAAYWYNRGLIEHEPTDGFVNHRYKTVIPCIGLSVAYWHLKEMYKANHYHNMAKIYEPLNRTVLENEKYFKE